MFSDAVYTRQLVHDMGVVLSVCLHDVVQARPRDPIDFIAHWLYKYSNNKLYYEGKQIYHNNVRASIAAERNRKRASQAQLKNLNFQLMSLQVYKRKVSQSTEKKSMTPVDFLPEHESEHVVSDIYETASSFAERSTWSSGHSEKTPAMKERKTRLGKSRQQRQAKFYKKGPVEKTSVYHTSVASSKSRSVDRFNTATKESTKDVSDVLEASYDKYHMFTRSSSESSAHTSVSYGASRTSRRTSHTGSVKSQKSSGSFSETSESVHSSSANERTVERSEVSPVAPVIDEKTLAYKRTKERHRFTSRASGGERRSTATSEKQLVRGTPRYSGETAESKQRSIANKRAMAIKQEIEDWSRVSLESAVSGRTNVTTSTKRESKEQHRSSSESTGSKRRSVTKTKEQIEELFSSVDDGTDASDRLEKKGKSSESEIPTGRGTSHYRTSTAKGKVSFKTDREGSVGGKVSAGSHRWDDDKTSVKSHHSDDDKTSVKSHRSDDDKTSVKSNRSDGASHSDAEKKISSEESSSSPDLLSEIDEESDKSTETEGGKTRSSRPRYSKILGLTRQRREEQDLKTILLRRRIIEARNNWNKLRRRAKGKRSLTGEEELKRIKLDQTLTLDEVEDDEYNIKEEAEDKPTFSLKETPLWEKLTNDKDDETFHRFERWHHAAENTFKGTLDQFAKKGHENTSDGQRLHRRSRRYSTDNKHSHKSSGSTEPEKSDGESDGLIDERSELKRKKRPQQTKPPSGSGEKSSPVKEKKPRRSLVASSKEKKNEDGRRKSVGSSGSGKSHPKQRKASTNDPDKEEYLSTDSFQTEGSLDSREYDHAVDKSDSERERGKQRQNYFRTKSLTDTDEDEERLRDFKRQGHFAKSRDDERPKYEKGFKGRFGDENKDDHTASDTRRFANEKEWGGPRSYRDNDEYGMHSTSHKEDFSREIDREERYREYRKDKWADGTGLGEMRGPRMYKNNDEYGTYSKSQKEDSNREIDRDERYREYRKDKWAEDTDLEGMGGHRSYKDNYDYGKDSKNYKKGFDREAGREERYRKYSKDQLAKDADEKESRDYLENTGDDFKYSRLNEGSTGGYQKYMYREDQGFSDRVDQGRIRENDYNMEDLDSRYGAGVGQYRDAYKDKSYERFAKFSTTPDGSQSQLIPPSTTTRRKKGSKLFRKRSNTDYINRVASLGRWVFLPTRGVIVFHHPILGELRSPQARRPIDDNVLETDDNTCRNLYDPEMYTVCDRHADDEEYAARMLKWTGETWIRQVTDKNPIAEDDSGENGTNTEEHDDSQ